MSDDIVIMPIIIAFFAWLVLLSNVCGWIFSSTLLLLLLCIILLRLICCHSVYVLGKQDITQMMRQRFCYEVDG